MILITLKLRERKEKVRGGYVISAMSAICPFHMFNSSTMVDMNWHTEEGLLRIKY